MLCYYSNITHRYTHLYPSAAKPEGVYTPFQTGDIFSQYFIPIFNFLIFSPFIFLFFSAKKFQFLGHFFENQLPDF